MNIGSRPDEADEALEQALRLLDRTPLLDGHNDLPYLIRDAADGDVAQYDLRRRSKKRDTDIPRLTAGRVSAQFWAAFVPPREQRPASYALQQIALIQRMTAMHADVFMPATRSSDVRRAKQRDRIACFIAIENGSAIENRLDALPSFYRLGVRLMTLCHNATTDWCDSATDTARHGGMTEFGRKVIAEMNRLGMLVDLSHASDAATHQVLDMTRAPVVFSHSNARTICNHPRNVPDDVLARVPANGGMVMATFLPRFISRPATPRTAEPPAPPAPDSARHPEDRTQGTLAQFCDHLDYLAATIGHDHIGIGSDFFGGPQGAGLEDASCYPHIFAELIRRGWSHFNLRKLASGNLVRVLREVEQTAATRGGSHRPSHGGAK
jgi:membrane dipeptidase